MKHRILIFIIAIFVPLLLLSAEPSAFGAGDINSPNPYGMTSSEEVIFQNKKKLHKIVVKSNNQENEVDSLRERIDGIQSIIETISRKAHNNKINLNKFENKSLLNQDSTNEYEKRLSDLIAKNSLLIENNTKNIENLKTEITNISLSLDFIQKDYISKKEFNALVVDVNSFKDLIVKELKNENSNKTASSSADLYSQAKKDFNRQYYTQAIKNFKVLIQRNYKPAYSHFMIGEMYFKRKNYAKAITYFKKSASLYAKASYMS